jgi:hypothetical protein
MRAAVQHPAALGAHDLRVARGLAAELRVAKRAVAGRADLRVPRCVVQHPRPDLERRTMADVLRVPARELCHPVPLGVAAEADDRALHNHEGSVGNRSCRVAVLAEVVVARRVIGVLLVLTGAVWLGQGLGLIHGSSMTGSSFWAIAGAVCVVAGLGALSWPWRQAAVRDR